MKKELTGIYYQHNTGGKSFDELSRDMERDYFMSADEAVTYGLADRIITKRKCLIQSPNNKNQILVIASG
jgi:ATP-dependent Clp protease protease subunit